MNPENPLLREFVETEFCVSDFKFIRCKFNNQITEKYERLTYQNDRQYFTYEENCSLIHDFYYDFSLKKFKINQGCYENCCGYSCDYYRCFERE